MQFDLRGFARTLWRFLLVCGTLILLLMNIRDYFVFVPLIAVFAISLCLTLTILYFGSRLAEQSTGRVIQGRHERNYNVAPHRRTTSHAERVIFALYDAAKWGRGC